MVNRILKHNKMAEQEEEIMWPGGFPEAKSVDDFDFIMSGKNGGPITKISKSRLAEVIGVVGESIPAIQGGATAATAVALPAGPVGQNRWFDASWGYWKYNSVVLKNPTGTEGIPEGNDGQLYWNGTATTPLWSISKMQALPKANVINGFDSSATTEAGSAQNDKSLNDRIEGVANKTTLVLSDFTNHNGATASISGGTLRISNDASVGWAYSSIAANIDIIEFQMSLTLNGFWNPSPNWIGVGFKGNKLVVLNIRTNDTQRGDVYEIRQGFGIDSVLLKTALDIDNGAYTLTSGDWVRVKRVGQTIELYKKVIDEWVHLGTSDLSTLGLISLGFSFLNSYVAAATTTLSIASNIKQVSDTIGIKQRLNLLESNIITPSKEVDLGYYRKVELDDINDLNCTSSIAGENLNLKGDGTGVPICWLEPSIKGIEFTVPTVLTDGATQFSFVVSKNKLADIFSYITLRTNSTAPNLVDLFASNPNSQAIDGSLRMAAPNGKAEKTPIPIAVGDRLRFLIVDNKIHCWIKKTGTDYFVKNFVFDKRSIWLVPTREGFDGDFCFGVCRPILSANTDDIVVFKDLKVLDYKINNEVTEIYKELSAKATTDLLIPKERNQIKWVAIGDSIVESDESNKKGFIGFANANLGFNLINKGYGGWTIYKLWRDRAIGRTTGNVKAGWIDDIIGADVVTLSAGTNDFDTTFAIPASDAIMDTLPDPHPRFGTFDKEDADFKNPHTTLGALRLMIEYILTNAPQARLVITTPMYRLKKSISGGVITTWTVNSEGRSVKDYADAITKVALEYNLEVVDFYNAGVNELNIDKYTYDKLHTNEFGARHYGNILYKILK